MRSRTKALQISRDTKEKVWNRQQGKSIYSNKPISIEECCCHYVSRARSGLGIEENVIGLTWDEHPIFDLNEVGDHKEEHDEMRRLAKKHLKECYPYWNESILVYKKGSSNKPNRPETEYLDLTKEGDI